MSSKTFRRVGVAAVLALAIGSIAALAVVKRGMAEADALASDAAHRGPDPITLVAADVAAVRDDVRALSDGVAANSSALHAALEASAGERDASLVKELSALRRELAAIRERADRDAAEAAAFQTRMDAAIASLAAALERASSAQASSVSAASVDPDPPRAEDASVASAPSATALDAPPLDARSGVAAPLDPPAADASSADAPVAEAAPKKSFLAFTLPSQGFAFDRRQRFAIVPSLSRVGFDAKSTLHDFSGVTTDVEGEIAVNLARPSDGCDGFVSARSSSLDTGLAGRDEAMRELLEPGRFPELRFDWTAFETTTVDAKAQAVAGVARGKLTIHGVARDVALPVTVAVDASKRLAIDGETRIALGDFGLEPPSKLGVISVEHELTLWIALRARTLGPASEAQR